MIINIGLRFVLEICVLIAVSYWGFFTGKGMLLKWLLGIGAPLIIIIVWGLFGSPAAQFPLTGTNRLILEIFIFSVGALALFAVGKQMYAVIFILLVIMNRILMYIWDQ